jgi:hypothetical protein
MGIVGLCVPLLLLDDEVDVVRRLRWQEATMSDERPGTIETNNTTRSDD